MSTFIKKEKFYIELLDSGYSVARLEGDYKVLIINDLHLKASNFKGRKDYVNEIFMYLNNLKMYIISEGINVLIFLGDVFHDSMSESQSAQVMLKFTKWLDSLQIVKFTLQGNHERHNLLKGCPFYDITGFYSKNVLKDIYEYRLDLADNHEHLYCVDYISINDSIIFDCLHFSEHDTNFTLDRLDNKHKRIALYHRPMISSQIKNIAGTQTFEILMKKIGSVELDTNHLLDDYVYACIGDIHTRIGRFKVGECICNIAGSIGRTSSSETQIHTLVELDMFNIQNSDIEQQTYRLTLLPFEESYDKNLLDISKEKRTHIKDFKQLLERTYECLNIETVVNEALISNELKTMILKGIAQEDIRPDNINAILNKYR